MKALKLFSCCVWNGTKGKFHAKAIAFHVLFHPTCYFNTWRNWVTLKALNLGSVYVHVCLCVILVWIWVLSIILQGNLNPWRALCVVKEHKKLYHCQALTWTALQSTPLRAAILERLAWGEIAAWRPGIHIQHQPRHPLKKKEMRGLPLAVQDWRSPEFWACSQTFLISLS